MNNSAPASAAREANNPTRYFRQRRSLSRLREIVGTVCDWPSANDDLIC